MSTQLCYVSGRRDGLITTVRFDDKAETAEVVSRLNLGPKPMPLELNRERRLLRVATGADPLRVSTLKLLPDGSCQVLSEVNCPLSATYLSFTPDDRMAFVVSYHASRLAWAPVWDNHLIDDSAWHVEQVGEQPHCVEPSPDGRHVYVVELGANRVQGFRVSDGELVADEQIGVQFEHGTGPRHLVFDASGEHGYLIEELGGHIVHLSRDPDSGRLTVAERVPYSDRADDLRPGVHVPSGSTPSLDDQTLRHWGAELALDPQRHWILASERRASTLNLQALNDDGSFGARLDHVPTEKQPRGMGLIGDHHVIAGAELGDTATIYRVDDQLEPVAEVEGLGGPVWFASIGS